MTVDGREKLATVKRDRPAGDPTGGTATLAHFVYNVPTTGPGLPDLSRASVDRWGQKATPSIGFAVFGPDHPVNSTNPDEIGSGDWEHADLQYTDANGYTINTAEFGAGGWQYTATDYNDHGNIVRELDERALRLILDNQVPAGATADQLASLTIYNPDIKNAAGDTVVTPAGMFVTDTYGPARYASLTDGTVRWVRPHTRIEHDQAAPNQGIHPDTAQPYRLPTTETAAVQDPGSGTDLETVARTLTSYAPTMAGDPDGWRLGLPGRITTDLDLDGTVSSGDLTKVTRFDTEGRAIEARQPASNGSDAGTSRTVYYTATSNTSHPDCGGKPHWAGLICKSYPAAPPASEPGQPTTPSLPTITTTKFNYLLSPTEMLETSGSVTRTTTSTYLADGSPARTTIAVTGLPGSTPTTTKETSYDPAIGLPTTVTARNGDGTVASTVTTAYDTWARPVSYQPSGDQATATTYNSAGAVDTVADANGSTRYSYDGIDASGKKERRGLVTRVDVTTAGATWSSSGAYDADGSMVTQKLPGGITQHVEFDPAGELHGLRYTGQITTVNEDGSTTIDPDGGWLSWSMDNDVVGRLAREWTPDGAAFTGPAGGGSNDPGDALPYDLAYRYDAAGRLTQVRDRSATTAGIDITDPTQAPPCTTRSYAFDGNDNRRTQTTTPSAADGSCTTTGGATVARAFDTADRPTSGRNGAGAYSYDLLGRATTLPAADTPKPSLGDVALTYYDNDLVRSITQAEITTTFTLDALDRRSSETLTGAASGSLTRHYTDTSDNPTWVSSGSTSQRYVELIGGDLALTVNPAGSGELTIARPGGHIVTTVPLTAASAVATSIDGWNAYDEYGNPVEGNSADTGLLNYGWLGVKQRAVSGAGLTLMGVRVYNPTTGLFTSVDPVAGGNANDYTYPTDPINSADLSGQMIKPDGPRSFGIGANRRIFARGQDRSAGRGVIRPPSYGGLPRRLGVSRRSRNERALERIEGRGATSVRVGQFGSRLSGVKQSGQKITIHGRNRIPDYYSKKRKTIAEVKFYRSGRTLGATRQIRDMADWAQRKGWKFVLRVNRGVKLSKNLQKLARSGRVIISRY